MDKKPSLEENLKKLESILQDMESSETTLEDSLDLYRQGTLLYEACAKEFQAYQLEVEKLQNSQEVARGSDPIYAPLNEDESAK